MVAAGYFVVWTLVRRGCLSTGPGAGRSGDATASYLAQRSICLGVLVIIAGAAAIHRLESAPAGLLPRIAGCVRVRRCRCSAGDTACGSGFTVFTVARD